MSGPTAPPRGYGADWGGEGNGQQQGGQAADRINKIYLEGGPRTPLKGYGADQGGKGRRRPHPGHQRGQEPDWGAKGNLGGNTRSGEEIVRSGGEKGRTPLVRTDSGPRGVKESGGSQAATRRNQPQEIMVRQINLGHRTLAFDMLSDDYLQARRRYKSHFFIYTIQEPYYRGLQLRSPHPDLICVGQKPTQESRTRACIYVSKGLHFWSMTQFTSWDWVTI